MRRYRTLRSRLFTWFVGAILLAMLTSALVVATTRPEPVTGAEAVARNVSAHLASTWDEPEATRAYLGEIRDVTGFDVRLLRDPHRLMPHVRKLAERGVAIAPEGPAHIVIPVVRGGTLLGALEMDRFGPRSAPWAWWRFVLALLLVIAVLSTMAGRVADQLSRPLERLAQAADRFGGGDLGFRTDVAGGGRRWVAQEVRDVAVSFNRMAERVEAMVRGQRELLGAISHELRSPLGRARIALEIARDRMSGDPREHSATTALDDVENQLGAVDSILGDLLDLTRAGLADLRKETRDLVDWLRARIAQEPSPPPIELVVAEDARDLALAFDPTMLATALHNLLVNARAHGHPEERAIEVRLTHQGDSARIIVRDGGSGFPEGFIDRAFEPFVRGDASRARPSTGAGYGLGLAIVRRIVEAHGGRVFAQNVGGPAQAEAAGVDRAGAEVGFDLPVLSSAG